MVERALLAYVLALIALLTLSPFRFGAGCDWQLTLWGDHEDAFANIALFLPVGYFLRLAWPQCRRGILAAALFGLLFSSAIEGTQLFLPERLTALLDIVGNTIGCVMGAGLCDVVRRRLSRVAHGQLGMEHPLLQVLYLTLPLMWLCSLGLTRSVLHIWLLAPLGLVGAVTLCGLWRHHYARTLGVARPLLVLAVMAWFLFGALPALRLAPEIVVASALPVLGVALVQLYRPLPGARQEKRGEQRVLMLIWPCFLAYLVMLVLGPDAAPAAPFSLGFGYAGPAFYHRDLALRVAEQLGALTLLGYLLAESVGRSRLTPGARRALGVVVGMALAMALEIAHGFRAEDQASIARWLLGSAAASFGALLYGARLDVIRILTSRPPETAPERTPASDAHARVNTG